MKAAVAVVVGLAVLVVAVVAVRGSSFPELRGPYLGQKPPGMVPERFAEGIVSAKYGCAPPVFTADGREAYWSGLTGRGRGKLFTSRVENGVWTRPSEVFAGVRTLDAMPSLSADGRTMLFVSRRPVGGTAPQPACFGVWTTTRSPGGWSEPTPLASPINVGFEDFSCLSADGTLYFSTWRPGGPSKNRPAIYTCARTAAGFGDPVRLPEEVNGGDGAIIDWVSPDQRTMIFERSLRGQPTDLYVSSKGPDGAWGRGLPLTAVNTPAYEHFASVSPDGKVLFFSSDRGGTLDVWWVDASVIVQNS